MIERIDKLSKLKFGQLMAVYEEGNAENGRINYPYLSSSEQILAAEQDFYQYLQLFFSEKDSFYVVLLKNEQYVCALRLEPYQDGLLLEALETKPSCRRKGYAKTLITETVSLLREKKDLIIYSHISKNNIASIATHETCAFRRVLDYAVYIDGSVNNRAYTYCYRIGEPLR